MTRTRFAFFRLTAALAAVSASAFAFAASVRDVVLTFVDLAFPPTTPALWIVGATETPRTLGLARTRSFHARRLARVGDQRSRAPDSMAFATA